MAAPIPIRMPKWGLSMQEGTIVNWWKSEGAVLREGEELVDIETTKITNVFEAPGAGVLRKVVAAAGETVAVGGLIAVLADETASDADIETFIAEFTANFKPGEADTDSAGALTVSTVEAAGRTIRVGRAGTLDGQPIVLIHGFSGDMNNWLFNIDALSAVGPVVAVDLPGHGGSSKDVGDGALATLAATVMTAIDGLHAGKIRLVGHSLGGAVAARMAADHPDRISRLVLIAPALLPGTDLSGEFLGGIVESQRARDLKPWLEMLFADPSVVTKDMIEEMVRFKRMDGVEDALFAIRSQMMRGTDAAALASDLHRIESATIVVSLADRIVGRPDASQLPGNFRVIAIEGAGHMPHLEKAAEVNAILTEALA
jgi:pyruvate dehydrogenase E2 component (dihydrolipoamide acetyltransferase)